MSDGVLFQKEEAIISDGEKKLKEDFFSSKKEAKAYESLLKQFKRLSLQVVRLTSISDRVQADLSKLNNRLNTANEEINEKNLMLEKFSKQLSRDLEDTEEKYRSIFENAVEGMFQSTPSGVLIAANTSMAKMLGYKTVIEILESQGSTFQYCAPKQLAAFRRKIEGQGVVREYEMIMRRKDGVDFPVSVNARLVVNEEDGSIMYEGSVVDITGRKEKEEALLEREAALASSKAKSAFLAKMSHDIRTPMNAVIGMANLLSLSAGLDAKQREYVDIINSAAINLLGILNDILDLSKVEAGKLVFEDTPFVLRDTVESVPDMFLEQLAAKPIELLVDISPSVPKIVVADPIRLRQVLINLLSNAFKFTEAGKIHLKVSLVRKNQDTAEVMFSVSDTGKGIDEKDLSMIFLAYAQASNSRGIGGTGLGLAICKEICLHMGGDIWVESKPGKGTQFTFTVQMALGEAPDIDEVPLDNHNILLVTHSLPHAMVLIRVLNEFGAKVQLVETVAEAHKQLKILDAEDDCVVLVDADLPGASGLELIQQLLIIRPTGRTKALLMGPYGDTDLQDRAIQAGAKGYLSKPIKAARLLNEILEALDLKGSASSSLPRGHSIAGARLLVVEDNTFNQYVAIEILNLEHIHVDCADNGPQAIEMLSTQSYDAVLMDIQMPGMSGLEATKAIREMPHLKQLPIIAMTANAMQGDRERCLEAGMDDYVTKPINRLELLKTLGKYVRPITDEVEP